MSNKFAFFGTPEVASETLEVLFEHGYTPTVVVTSPDRRSGRGMHMTETPVSLWAKEKNITCLKPEKIDDDFIHEFKTFGMDLSIVIAYGKIIPEVLINLPKSGTINIHYSLLPKYRGASPVEEALLHGDSKTGVSIQKMQFKLDTGPIIKDKEVDIFPYEVKTELLQRLTKTGAELLVETLPKILKGDVNLKTQDETSATYCKKMKKEDGLLDLDENKQANYNKYRAFYGWPGTYFFKNNKRVKITKAKYENDSFIIERVVPEGKKEISYSDFLNSNI